MRLGNHVYITAILLCAFASTGLSAYASISQIDLRGKLIADGLIDPPLPPYVDRYAEVLIPPRKPALPQMTAMVDLQQPDMEAAESAQAIPIFKPVILKARFNISDEPVLAYAEDRI